MSWPITPRACLAKEVGQTQGMVRCELSLRKMFKVCLELACVHYGDRRPLKKRGHQSTPGTCTFSFSGPIWVSPTGAPWSSTGTSSPGRPCPFFQPLHWFAERASIQELKDLQAQLKKRLLAFLPKGESAPLILDFTCLPCRSKSPKLKWRKGQRWERFVLLIRNWARRP